MNSLINQYLGKFSEEERLKRSIIYGWSLVIFGGIIPLLVLSTVTYEGIVMIAAWMWMIGCTLFAFRYTSAKPILGAASEGIKVMGIAYIIDLILSRRNGGGGALLGAFVGVMFILMLIFTKNLVVGLYYLSKETYRYIQFKKNEQVSLEQTNLFEEPVSVQV
jgi:hypothetical protein